LECTKDVCGQFVVAMNLQAALAFLFGQPLLSGFKSFVDVRGLSRPIALLFRDSLFLCRCFESASSMVLLLCVERFVAPKGLAWTYLGVMGHFQNVG